MCLALGGRKMQSHHPVGTIQNSEFALLFRIEGSQASRTAFGDDDKSTRL